MKKGTNTLATNTIAAMPQKSLSASRTTPDSIVSGRAVPSDVSVIIGSRLAGSNSRAAAHNSAQVRLMARG